MSYFDSDALEMLEVYLLETRQLTAQLSSVLMDAEKRDTFTEEEIHTIFRVMHTIKSSSAMMGLGGLASMAHKLEDLFAYFREQHQQIGQVGQGLFDLLFAASDLIESELERMRNEDYQPAATAEIEAEAEACLAGLNGTTGAGNAALPGNSNDLARESASAEKEQLDKDERTGSEEDPSVRSAAEGERGAPAPDCLAGKAGTIVRVLFEPGCRMENIRAFMLVRQITSDCSCVETYPADLEKSGQCSGYIKENGVFIRFESDQKEQVLERLKKGLFVQQCDVLSDIAVEKSDRETAEEEKTAPLRGVKESEYLNVRLDRLDYMQNMAGELMIQMTLLDDELEQRGLNEIREGTAYQISRLIGEVERNVMQMRMVPVEQIVPKIRRILRDMCRDQGKEAELKVSCGGIEADKSVVEYASECLIHIIRNAVDHGIERPEERGKLGKNRKGTVTFTAESTSGELRISLEDDGQGIDPERIKEKARKMGLFTRPEEEYDRSEILDLIMRPGFSTNDAVTEYSGRGVGLDVVKKIVEDAGGHLYIDTEMGRGTKFTMTVPMSLATMECVRFKVENYRFSLPARQVFRFLEFQEHLQEIRSIRGRDYILYENRMVPFIDLREFYRLGGSTPKTALLIYVKSSERGGCILVDEMYERKRIVIKPLPALLGPGFRRNTGISGLSVMGNGKICAALDCEILIRKYEREGRQIDG